MAVLDPASMRVVAERIIPGGVAWYSPIAGYCKCPGADLHHNSGGPRDCKVTLGAESCGKPDAPTISCFHNSCRGVVAALNRELRSAIGKAKARSGLGPRTVRTDKTPNFAITPEFQQESRTVRTVNLQPMRMCARAPAQAHAHTHTHAQRPTDLPSEASEPTDATLILDGEALRLTQGGKPLAAPKRMGSIP